MKLRSVVVFCGASEGYDNTYREVAYELGSYLAKNEIRLIYGGAKVGLMGALADGALQNGGHVTGVIPNFLETSEIANNNITELVRVDTMHDRKMKMYELSDGIITLPGGWGTMDEMFEMLTWAQLGLHKKPQGILNINGYYEPLKAMMDLMTQEGFLDECNNKMLLTSDSIEDLIGQMEAYDAPDVPALIKKQNA